MLLGLQRLSINSKIGGIYDDKLGKYARSPRRRVCDSVFCGIYDICGILGTEPCRGRYVQKMPLHLHMSHGGITMWRYSFRDSFLSLRFHRDLQEERRVEIFVGDKSVATI